ncbi:hypothetical protein VL23_10985 [Stenotrophomonas maltophilia]|uniref:Uncharacterized protein n=1 Tax=Stenotrophomonas maltophilia TaxID=40324 RepID=A0AB34TM95_STEMA|nr:hypothetical protein VL23_10985 [Stenotrophomonas maltophilia]
MDALHLVVIDNSDVGLAEHPLGCYADLHLARQSWCSVATTTCSWTMGGGYSRARLTEPCGC